MHGFAAGGNADTMSRIMADQLSKDMGQPFVVEAKPGAGGNIASAFVAKAPADGYTVQLLVGGHTASAALYKKLQFDPVKDYTFVSTVTKFPFFIAVKAGTFPSLQALIAKAKEKPGGLNFGSAGVGTTQHLTGELLAQRTGTRFTHIPYPGGPATITALLRGDVDFIVETGTVIKGQAGAGVIDILAVSSKSAGCTRRTSRPSLRRSLGLRHHFLDRHWCAGRHSACYRRKVRYRGQACARRRRGSGSATHA